MLTDRRVELERRSARARQQKLLPREFGEFIARLAAWDWFMTITFRNWRRVWEPSSGRMLRVPEFNESTRPQIVKCDEERTRYEPDPRLNSWRPTSRSRPSAGPPVPDHALALVRDFLSDLETRACARIGFVIAEEFGRLGRVHSHLLITGVSSLRRDNTWEEAFKRFGRTTIEPFDPERAAAFYTAKYAAKQLGGLHFGGVVGGIDLTAIEHRPPTPGGGVDVTRSADLPRNYFRNTLRTWHR